MKSKCLGCNKEIEFNPLQSSGKYCNNKCQQEYQFIEISKNIELGKVSGARALKRYLTKKRGYKCESCKLSSWLEKPISLHVDHIDGNSDNNLPSNLRFMCPNCHSQTETFCGRNKKNSNRSSYKRRYRIKNLHNKMVGTVGLEPTSSSM